MICLPIKNSLEAVYRRGRYQNIVLSSITREESRNCFALTTSGGPLRVQHCCMTACIERLVEEFASKNETMSRF
jgi:hypothetical protein